jgi:hypothetical protein
VYFFDGRHHSRNCRDAARTGFWLSLFRFQGATAHRTLKGQRCATPVFSEESTSRLSGSPYPEARSGGLQTVVAPCAEVNAGHPLLRSAFQRAGWPQ